jgi:transcription elongation GreA/GreB family factor
MHEVLLTPEGLARLQGELERLVTVERAAVTARLKTQSRPMAIWSEMATTSMPRRNRRSSSSGSLS